jgi:TetR/AcrR family transcriptional regulator, transcriptional repressor for nem operon
MNKAEKTRQFIIEKTAPLFNTKGVAATAVTDIMEVTQMAKGSLYVHFQNKEELSYCAVDWNLKQFTDKISAEAEKHSGAKEKFFGLLDYLSDPLNPPVKGGCPMMNFGMEADDTSPVIREKVHQTICTVQQGMVDILEQGIADGVFNRDWNYREFAMKAYAMIEGGILVARVSKDITQMKMLVDILKREINEQTIVRK